MRWHLRKGDNGAAKEISRALGIPGPVARVLASRGISDPQSARTFLKPALTDLHDPALLGAMAEATACIAEAVREGKRILIFGDYDADGLCGSSLVYRILKAAGGDVQVLIPDRLRDGYSLRGDAVSRILQGGAKVVITVDNGIGVPEEAKELAAAGVDLIIVDHHEPGTSIPPARAILNPKMSDSTYPWRDLCAAGVAFKLAWALSTGLPLDPEEARTILLDSLGVVALATVADVVPLLGENRVLVTFGLRALQATRTPGIRALVRSAGVRRRSVEARDIAFRMAPLLNAPGRLGEASLSLDLLVAGSEEEAAGIVRELGRVNRKRQSIQKTVLQSARSQMQEEMDRGRPALVLAEEGWHPGVTGIVAGKLSRESNLPTILITLDGEMGRASARSVDGVSLPEALGACEDLLVSYGGHQRAAGLVIQRENVEAFRERFCEAVGAGGGASSPGSLEVDTEVELREMDPPTVVGMGRLAPFGEGNPPPLLVVRRCRLAGAIRPRGRGFSFFLRQGDVALQAHSLDRTDLPAQQGGREKLTAAFRPGVGRAGEVDLEVVGFLD